MNNLKNNGATDLEYDGIETLGTNGTSDNNLRYVGATPNNYIYYNCSTTNLEEMNNKTCEKWRIIGLMNNIEDEYGNKASRVKIMRNEELGTYSWDSSESTINNGYGINQWGTSGTYEGADLMRELNTDYLGNLTVGTDGKWYSGEYSRKLYDMPRKTLNTNAQKMIETVKWNIGTNGNNDVLTWKTKNMYIYERSNNNGKSCSGNTNCNDEVTRTTTWTGKIALMYPSDFGYATSGSALVDKETCLNTTLYSWNKDSARGCNSNSWIYATYGNAQWTLTPRAGTSFGPHAHNVMYVGNYVDGMHAYNKYGVRPVLYLKSNVLIADGDGLSSNPYKLTM